MKREIAIYGKGGIGKSTIAANLSAALAEQARVLQIGCDPKHDSTRLLTGGRKIRTILDYIRETGPADYKLEDILCEGYRETGCMEAGGPKPGVGCAGRGIITAFELLDKFQLKQQYDYVVYDVLGDVVCGGFAVPIRREYADTIFLVTSGEFMSLYAANNILRGILNYDGEQSRVAGIIYNSRNVANEETRVEMFAQAVGLPVFARIPRHEAFAKAEKAGKTVVELGEEPARLFMEMAEQIREELILYPARPLSDEGLEALLMGTFGEARLDGGAPAEKIPDSAPMAEPAEFPPAAEPVGGAPAEDGPAFAYDPGVLSKNLVRSEPLHGCAFNGAMSMAVHLRDAAIVAHAPRSCAYLSWQTISSTGRRALFERGILMPSSLMPNLTATDMDENDMVFGGMERLMEGVKEAVAKKPKAVVIISSCPAGIIGDDIDQARSLSTPDCPVVTIKADGNLAGDYLQGMLMTYTQLAEQLVDPKVQPQPDTVNIVFEKVVAKNTETNYQIVRGFLQRMGIRVNCRFLCDTGVEDVRNFCSASLNLLGYRDYTGKILEEFFTSKYGCRFYERQLPVGFEETAAWLRGIGAFFSREKEAEQLIAEHESVYRERIVAVREKLQGKRLLVITFNHQLDWVLSAALDAGMEIVKICVFNFSQDEGFRSYLPQAKTIEVEENFDPAKAASEIQRLVPDILLTNYESDDSAGDVLVDTIPMCPDVGFLSGLEMAERWTRLTGAGTKGSWHKDRKLVEKYFAR